MVEQHAHGGAIDLMRAQFPDAPSPWIDLSTGINPWPYRGTTLARDVFDALPTRASINACKIAMSQMFNCSQKFIHLSPGSELLIRLLPQWLSAKRVAILEPTYSDHSTVWRLANCEVIEAHDPLNFTGAVDVITVCNPNNPNGQRFDPEVLRRVRERQAERGGWLVIDEAYSDIDPSVSLTSDAGADGLIILKSFGKFFGLAGVRLGTILAPPSLQSRIANMLGAWPVSTAALTIATHAYGDTHWHDQTRRDLKQARIALDQVLRSNDFDIQGGTDLFRFIRVENASVVWRKLAESGIYVRRFESMGNRLRIGIPGSDAALARLNIALSLSEL